MIRILLPLLVFISIFIAVADEGGVPPKIKVLIVEGVTNHAWEKRLNIVRAILAKDGSFDVDFTVSPSAAGDPAWATWRPKFRDYDVVISGYNNLGGLPSWPQEVKDSFFAYVHGGGGFYAFHEANNSFAEWPQYNQIIGLGWRDKSFGKAITVNADSSLNEILAGAGENTNHGARQDVLVTKRGTHPIHAGLPATWMVADIEVYRYARGPAENLTVLSYAADRDGTRFPIDWTVEYGAGRTYASSYCHVWGDVAEPPGARCAAFQTVFLRAMKWLAKRDPGSATPADFPTPAATSLRSYEEGVSGLDSAPAVSPFNNGILPTKPTPVNSVAVEQAFANLSLDSPIQVTPFPGSSDLLVAETDGRLYRVPDDDATTTRTLLLDIRDRAWYYNWTTNDNGTKHGGMQTFALHPRFGKGEGRDFIYIFYLHNEDDAATASTPYYDRLSRFTWNAGGAAFDAASELILINQYDTTKGHDGGGLVFGPDGFLYIAYGDEGIQGTGAAGYTQMLDGRVRSGVWRIDVDQQGGSVSHPIIRQPYNASPSHGSYTQGYFIPNDNPWVNPDGSVMEEFYAIGLRQPHRMTHDAATGFWIGDVGHESREEVDVVDAPGLNFQWNYKEGNAAGFRAAPVPLIGTERAPVFDYSHSGADSLGNCVIGGYVYRGTAIPFLQGKYIFGDNGSQGIHALDYNTSTKTANSVTRIGQARSGNIWTGISSFGHDADGELFVTQMGAGQAGNGRIFRIMPDTGTIQNSIFPATLSATGLFTNVATLATIPALIPYEVNMPLWSDGTEKQRWMMIPGDGTPNMPAERITYSGSGRWNLPVGSVLVKHFALPGGVKLETRLLVRGSDGEWGGVTYKWRADGSEADLLEEGANETMVIGGDPVDYLYPARTQCNTCHSTLAGGVLGLSTRQLNRSLTYATGRTVNQIETLSELGFIESAVSEVSLRNALASSDRADESVGDEDFVRAYLDSNCSHCHLPGGNRANFDARLTTPLAFQNLLCGVVNDDLGIDGAAVIKPGLTGQSMLLSRMNTIAGHRMPPIGRGRIDQEAVVRLANWISGMEVDSCAGPQGSLAALESQAIGNGNQPATTVAADTWHSNMVINKTETFTNTTGATLDITFDRFLFHASAVTGTPLTPFVVRVNAGTNNFTVRAIGDTVTTHALGANDLPFAATPVTLALAAGETIAMGFLDAYPNGSGAAGAGDISWDTVATADSIHYSGASGVNGSFSVTVGSAPDFGSTVNTTFGRNYYYSITFLKPWRIGNEHSPGASPAADTWASNMIINETDTFTNDTGVLLNITVDRFLFHAAAVTGTPLTPFVVRVNGDNNFTVVAVGSTVTSHVTGANNVSFSAFPVPLTLAPGETIAMGFLDANADGSGASGAGVVAFNSSAPADQIHYSGGSATGNSGSVAVGLAPGFGSSITTTFGRNYFFSITITPTVDESDMDDDGLPDTWERAYAAELGLLEPGRDSDGDGFADEDERQMGTHPLDATSRLQVIEWRPDAAGQFVLGSFSSIPGRSYRLLVSDDLTTWTDRGVIRAAHWPASETPFELDPGEALPGKLFIKVATLGD
ncbi:ThuA domain-containing protein [Luteolibacter arcticus]|uniref:ThuA domain-containing protein n=1 Tax=Luteolibacter arcticus TaxID=1581411 RepID=A0ABT3GQF3_9BACT|nr:ThuA domain-containing protein [Luteolibacter arcticus]MCW1925733.1 ThuA domain-containing protein [Luteolibacter arcticus]